MNRGPFIHGWARWRATHSNNRGYRHISPLRKIINLVCFLLGLGIIVFVFTKGLAGIFVPTAIFFLILVSIPTTMSVGKDLVLFQNDIAVNQKRAELPVEFNRKKAIIGYILMFTPLYLLMLGGFFFPAYNAWILFYIPTFLYTTVSVVVSQHTVENMDFGLRKYRIIHISLYILVLIGGMAVRAYIIHPWLVANG